MSTRESETKETRAHGVDDTSWRHTRTRLIHAHTHRVGMILFGKIDASDSSSVFLSNEATINDLT